MFIYTLLGLNLYAYKVFLDGGDYPRVNFNTFVEGVTTIFIIFIGDDWNTAMYNHIRSEAAGFLGSVLFFFFLYVMGNLILTNLFLAIMLKNF